MEHANIARVLERMGDHATRLAMLVRKLKSDKIKEPNATKCGPNVGKELKTIVHNMYTRDVALIHSAASLAKLRTKLRLLKESCGLAVALRNDCIRI